ncbi:MAG: SDR family NAD(P)-dependent oxidoreductase [Crocinitomicaceae bacterium]|nr:SDR family NAD(P)-dependent oxidoreductase [Crocinitomicaceae bacterium]
MKIRDKVFVITGAGSGMGREMTIQIVKLGGKVAMADINIPGMEETADLAGRDSVSLHELNIMDKTAVEALPKAVIEAHGQVDAIINNAGIIQPFVNVEELEYATIERIFNINLYGTIYMTKAFLPLLKERPEAHITNISSMGGFIPFPGQTMYSASKAAVKILTEGLYAELKETNVGVTVVHPGAINTNIMSNSGVKTKAQESAQKSDKADKMAMPAAKAASIIINGIEKNKYRVLVGKDAKFLDLFYRLSPAAAVRFIVRQMSKVDL